MGIGMNWLQKIAKVIDTQHIPYQIYAALQYATRKDWKIHKQDSYRDWRSSRRDAAVFKASYSTTVVYSDTEKSGVTVQVMWQLPFDSKEFDTATGLGGMQFQAFLRTTPDLKGSGGWVREYNDKVVTSPLLATPNEVAEWVEKVFRNGFDDPKDNDGGFDNDNDDDSDLFPEWPYPEEEEVDSEQMAVIKRNPGYMG